MASCRKSDNERIPEITKIPFPLLKKDATGDATISAQTPDAFVGKFSVGIFATSGEKPAKYDVVIRKNEDNKTAKVFKTDVTTFPTDLSVTGVQLRELFGATVVLGDKFDIGVDITTTSGQKFQAFPLVGVAFGTNVVVPAGSAPTIRFESICKFTAAEYAGNFKVLEDDWNDYVKGSVIPVTVVNDHQLSIISPVSGAPIIIDVDVNTNVTSMAKQAYGDYKAAGIDPTWTYGMVSVESVPGASNFVAPCTLILSVKIKYTVAAGNFGEFDLVLQKQ